MAQVAVGIGVRDEYLDDLLALEDRTLIDVLEILIDEDLERSWRRKKWRALGAKWPLVGHGTELGIGDADGVDEAYVHAVGLALTDIHALWYADHLCWLRAGDLYLGHFGPLDDDEETLKVLRTNAELTKLSLPCPFVLENAADVLGFGGTDPTKRATSYARSLAATGAGALLDLTNLVYDARNEGFDPMVYLDALPWWRVVQVHLAGGFSRDGLWIDAHDRSVDDEAMALLPVVAARAENLRAVIIERDDHLPPLTELLDEVQTTKMVLAEAGRR